MTAFILSYNKFHGYFNSIKSENIGFYFSVFLHLLLLLSAIGLPNFFDEKPIFIPTIIPIEILNVSEVTSIPKDIKETKSAILKNTKVKEKKFNSSDNQEIKKIEIKDKPKIKEIIVKKKILPKENFLIREKKEVLPDLKKQKNMIEQSEYENLPTKKIKPKLKPNFKSSDIKPILNSDVRIKDKPKPKSEPAFNIASMLKDLRNEKSTKEIKSDNEEKEDISSETKIDENSPKNAQLSISEIDLVLQQLSRCFIAPAGAEIKKTMFVKISAKIQQNRRVYENSVRIVDTNISKSNPVYGPITESAMRTLLNPECIPLKLPEDKYESWKNLTMKFDYSVMRGD